MKKKYVPVSVSVNTFGDEMPTAIIWNQGKQFTVSRVLHICEAADHEYDGIRYTVRIGNSERDIYRDDGGWYIDAEKVRLYG